MKKLLTLLVTAVLAVTCCFGLTACGEKPVAGLICLHGENSTYDKNFIDAFKTACENKGVKYVIATDINEDDSCYNKAAEFVDSGCKVIFADSFGHEKFMIQAAKEFTDVEFCHATGTQAKQESSLANYHNAFASIYEGRYLAGYAAGLKLNTMKGKAVDNNFKVGYVGAYTYAEVISGLTSWFLGLEAALDEGYTATMEVQFTGSWYDETLEKEAAETLMNNGAVLVSQHADSMGAPTACDTASVPNVSYNGTTGKNTNVAYSKINWVPYFEYMLDNYAEHKIAKDYCGTILDGSVVAGVSTAAADGTAAKLEEVKTKINNGEIKIFDCSKFTVKDNSMVRENIIYQSQKQADGSYLDVAVGTTDDDGRILTYKADVNGDYLGDTNVIKTVDGVTFFDESNATDFRSAPYFDLTIDGITFLNAKF